MKRKFTCMILALVLVISLLPLGAIPTQAASNLNYSENVVNLIKQFEGFSASALLGRQPVDHRLWHHRLCRADHFRGRG